MQEQLNNTLKLIDKTDIQTFGKPDKYDYSKYSALEEFDWDEDLASKLSPAAEKLNLSQESLEMLLDLALEMSQKQKDYYEKNDELKKIDNIKKYNELFIDDIDLPRVNSLEMKKYIETANTAYSDFASPKLKEILEDTGLVYHPELIKMFHKIGELSQEDNLSHCGAPATEELTPAQILYGTK